MSYPVRAYSKNSQFVLVDDQITYRGKAPQDDLQAKQISLDKWGFIVELLEAGIYFNNMGGCYTCGFCLRYNMNLNHCEGCPVYLVTGYSHCMGTPYTNFEYLFPPVEKGVLTADERSRLLPIARREVAFLESIQVE